MSLLNRALTPLGILLRTKRADEEFSVAYVPELASPSMIAPASPRFSPGTAIPVRHTGHRRGQNGSPG